MKIWRNKMQLRNQLTLTELIEKLSTLDEVDILEILNLNSADILHRFEDVVEDNYDKLIREIE
tara:strand:+ start:3864 stop:4052 length:189 start_codon:yes stop_codon:yes gene_type:complete